MSIVEKRNPWPLRMLAVGLSTYPDRPGLSLPSVKQELEGIAEIVEAINGHYEKPLIELVMIEDAEARVDLTLNAMKAADIVHLACHGCQDGAQPLDSHLILSNGVLRLREILSAELSNTKFGFLSACQTATGDVELANESFHLAGGLLSAGLKGAIGTLWSIADEDAPEVAREVYKATVSRDGLDLGKAAEGLQNAVRKMREKNLPPHRWIPFIHVGI
jgi:CHAT domain-containing protein